MALFSVLRDYLVWHYSTAYVDALYIWWNYLWFVNHLFSVPDVLRSFFAPFRRLEEAPVNIIKDPGAFFGNLFVNLMMRIVGMILRAALLAIAFLLFLITLAAGAAFLALWTVLPVLVAHFFTSGVRLLVF